MAGERAAHAAAALIDGAILEAVATGLDLDTADLEAALARLLS